MRFQFSVLACAALFASSHAGAFTHVVQKNETLAQIAEYSPLTLNLVEDNAASQVQVGLVTGNYFDVMGLRPVLGRLVDM